jgi:hypothetical protein
MGSAAAGVPSRRHSSTNGSRPVASVAAGAGPDSCRADPVGRRRMHRWIRWRGPGPAGTPPTWVRPPRRRSQTMPSQHVRDRRGGDPDAKLDELAFDPQVAPPGVLPSHAEDQLAQFGIDGRTARTAARLRSRPALELPAPALQRVGDNREGGPPLLREATAHGGEEGPVGDAVAGPLPPTGEEPQLMAQHGDLQLPIIDACADE